ncbi:BLUF domain-containing protein [Zunongwangia endophytica]|uniref:BLUF domain-containing protein n=1 Tax=Zunongwangia endophytica TaxID=1808945 RepID=A0ABV8HE37_9FLAO|nr:BLUF domain-containing protein [Zunongwangia endophytica]MDN3596735.1 BLUF domain-containing protein [Zunongwangia endophytica]
MKRWAICYVSSAAPLLTDKDVDEVLSWTQSWNLDHNLTGMLLYSDGNFFQVIEGETETVKGIFSNIYNDTRHRNLIKIFDKQIDKNSFEFYETNFISKRSKNLIHDDVPYLKCLETLDKSSQIVVRNILSAFLSDKF